MIHSEKWKNRSKHIFILNYSGKPIYSRYGDETKLASIVGVLSLLISFTNVKGENIKCVTAGNHKIVFKIIGPIWLVCSTSTGESISSIERQLEYIHEQIIFSLTKPIAHGVLEKKPQFDLRSVLVDFEKDFDITFDELIKWTTYDHSILFNSVRPFRLKYSIRHEIGNILLAQKCKGVLFILVIADNSLVQLLKPKNHTLHPLDVHLILNYVSRYRHVEEKESRICLPLFDPTGFFNMYISSLSENVNLIFLYTEQNIIDVLRKCRDDIFNAFKSTLILKSIETSLAKHKYQVYETKINGLISFIYKSLKTSQITSPVLHHPYNKKKEKRRLIRIYTNIYDSIKMHNSDRKVYYQIGQREIVVVWITSGFDLYAIFSPTLKMEECLKNCNSIIRWVRKEEDNLFLLDSPVW